MSEQGKALPAELLGDLQHIVGIVPDGVTAAWRTVIGMTVAGKIQGHNTQPWQKRSQAGKTGGIVQPPMQGNHRHTVFRAIQMGGQFDMRQP